MKTKSLVIFATLILLIIVYLVVYSPDDTPAAHESAVQQQVVEPFQPVVEPVVGYMEQQSTQKISPKQAAKKPDNNGDLLELSMPSYQLPGDLILYLDGLFERYHQGDLEAGYVLAKNLRDCSFSFTDIDELNEQIRSWDFSAEWGITTKEKAANAKRFHVSRFYFCKDVSREIREQYIPILEAIAEQGHIPAQQTFGILFEPIDVNLMADTMSQDKRDKWQQQQNKAKVFLENAARHGSLLSLKVLSERSRTEQNKDLVSSLSYGLAFLNFVKEAKYIDEYRKIKADLESQMTAEEVEQANASSRKIINEIISNGVIYEP